MADTLKTVIKIETDGVEKFLNTTKQVEKEILQIEKTLKKQGFKGNEKELKATAKAYRNAMVKAAKDIEKRELQRVDKVKTATKSLNKVASRLVIGRGIADFAQRLIAGLGDVIEKNKDLDESAGKAAVAIANVQNFLSKMALTIIRNVIPAVEFISKTFLGVSLETEKASDSVRVLQRSFNDQIEVLKEGNLSQEARRQLLIKVNEVMESHNKNLLDENSTLEDITIAQNAVNAAFEKKILLLATEETFIDLTKRRLESLKEEVALQIQLNQQKEAEAKAIRDNNTSLKSGINLALSDARQRISNVKASIAANKENLAVIQREKDLLDSVIKTEGIDIKTDFVGLDKNDDEVIKAVGTGKTTIDVFLDTKVDAGLITDTIKDVREDFKDAIDESDFVKAAEAIELMKVAEEELKKVTDELGQSEKTLVELKKESLKATQNITKESSKFEVGGEIGQITPAQIALGASIDGKKDEAEVERIIKRVYDKSVSVLENLPSLREVGISSPILEALSLSVDGKKRIEEGIDKQQELIKKQGIEVAKLTTDVGETVIESEKALGEARIKLSNEVNDDLLSALLDNLELLKASGDFEFLDAFFAKVQEFENKNKVLLKTISDTESKLSIAKKGDDNVLVETLENLLSQLQDIYRRTLTIQKNELKDLREVVGEELFADAVKQINRENRKLKVALELQKVIIQQAEDKLDKVLTNARDKNSADGEKYSQEELNLIKAHINLVIALEERRYESEREIFIASKAKALQDIKEKGGDVDLLTLQLNLEEIKLLESHIKRKEEILKKSPENNEADLKKTLDELKQIGFAAAQAFSDVFAAYTSFQDAVSQRAIDRIQEQVSNLDSSLSEVTGNIDSLESDLEGKRSGRREAVLRGIEIEKAREQSLLDKKLALERKLAAEEKKQSKRRKEAAIAQALINGAIAITNVWANSTIPYPAQAAYGAIQSIAIGAITGFEIATIEQQTFGDGGMLTGPSHAQGGIPFTVGGVPGFEAEGGEGIINKRSMADPKLRSIASAINQAGGGVAFADGGTTPNFGAMSDALSGSQRRQIESLSSQPMYVTVTDINNAQGRKVKVTDITNI